MTEKTPAPGTLRDYVEHKAGCRQRKCAWVKRPGARGVYDCLQCGQWTANLPEYKNDTCEVSAPCTCGLDALLASPEGATGWQGMDGSVADIQRRCRLAADEFEALCRKERVSVVVSGDLLLDAASLLRGYHQCLLVESVLREPLPPAPADPAQEGTR